MKIFDYEQDYAGDIFIEFETAPKSLLQQDITDGDDRTNNKKSFKKLLKKRIPSYIKDKINIGHFQLGR